jgi:hypothetical protein
LRCLQRECVLAISLHPGVSDESETGDCVCGSHVDGSFVGAGLNVETAADFPDAISVLAVAPLDCENDLACEQIERALMEDILAILVPVTVVGIRPEEVREEMANNKAKTGSATASLVAIARRHGCDAVLVARVRSSGGLEDTLATNDYGVGAANTIEILDAEGRELMRGWASIPTHPWQQNKANFAKVHFNASAGFEQILERSVE